MIQTVAEWEAGQLAYRFTHLMHLQDVYPLNEFTKTGLGLDFLEIPPMRADFQPDLGKRTVMLRGPKMFNGG